MAYINPVNNLKNAVREFTYEKLLADQNNEQILSGSTMYKDLQRMNFVINGKKIPAELVIKWREEIEKDLNPNKDKDYRLIAGAVFTKIFEYADAIVPNNSIIEE
ncbi:hypothetical protein [Wolbachia endosymbiont of Pentidionis agamae]|uniref:hypothetical protein n=1 Tax=Wolbachia endosymbiont of Pentidionis agamae TaxID=3110435 RepID=UPI002FD283B2